MVKAPVKLENFNRQPSGLLITVKPLALRGRYDFFTAQKRKTPGGGWEVVFLVSNMDLTAKEQVAAYDLRWPIEKMIS